MLKAFKRICFVIATLVFLVASQAQPVDTDNGQPAWIMQNSFTCGKLKWQTAEDNNR